MKKLIGFGIIVVTLMVFGSVAFAAISGSGMHALSNYNVRFIEPRGPLSRSGPLYTGGGTFYIVNQYGDCLATVNPDLRGCASFSLASFCQPVGAASSPTSGGYWSANFVPGTETVIDLSQSCLPYVERSVAGSDGVELLDYAQDTIDSVSSNVSGVGVSGGNKPGPGNKIIKP